MKRYRNRQEWTETDRNGQKGLKFRKHTEIERIRQKRTEKKEKRKGMDRNRQKSTGKDRNKL